MKYKLNDWQYKVATDNHRFRIVCAGRRSGKSVLSRYLILKQALEKRGLYWIVSPTYKTSKMIHWREFQREIPLQWISKKNEVELSITLKNGSIIQLKGAENPDALRGVKLRGIVIDEIASIRNWDWLWSEVLRPTLTDYEAPAIFISTPKGFNHFYELYNIGQRKEGLYKSWRFTSYKNPYIPKGEIDEAKKELTEDTFAQEYMADFRKFTGLVHKNWDRDINLIEPFDVPSDWQRGRGFDYGSAHYTASIRFAVNEDVWFIEKCYLDNKRKIKEHADAINAQDYGLHNIISYGDPSGKQWAEEFSQYNLFIQQADKTVGQNSKGWVEFCVEKVNERLKPIPGHKVYLSNGKVIENAPKMFVFNTPENEPFIKQIENMKWRSAVGNENSVISILDEGDDPVKGGHYDLMAALRYFVVSYKETVDDEPLPDDTKMFSEGGFY